MRKNHPAELRASTLRERAVNAKPSFRKHQVGWRTTGSQVTTAGRREGSAAQEEVEE